MGWGGGHGLGLGQLCCYRVCWGGGRGALGPIVGMVGDQFSSSVVYLRLVGGGGGSPSTGGPFCHTGGRPAPFPYGKGGGRMVFWPQGALSTSGPELGPIQGAMLRAAGSPSPPPSPPPPSPKCWGCRVRSGHGRSWGQGSR